MRVSKGGNGLMYCSGVLLPWSRGNPVMRWMHTSQWGHSILEDGIPLLPVGYACTNLLLPSPVDVTKAQCKQRAADRAQRKMGARDIRSFWGGAGGGDTLATQGAWLYGPCRR